MTKKNDGAKKRVGMIKPITTADVPRVAEIHVFGWRSTYRGTVSDAYLFTQMLVPESMKRFDSAAAGMTSCSFGCSKKIGMRGRSMKRLAIHMTAR